MAITDAFYLLFHVAAGFAPIANRAILRVGAQDNENNFFPKAAAKGSFKKSVAIKDRH